MYATRDIGRIIHRSVIPRSTGHRIGAGLGITLAVTLGTGCSSRLTASGTEALPAQSGAPYVVAESDSAAGRYLTIVGGCNDCHTPGWSETNGATPPEEQLTGNPVGFRGPWGTSYPANLRNKVQTITADRLVQILTTMDGGHGLPPMVWMNTSRMNTRDLRSIYAYIHSLGARGVDAPAPVAADSTPRTAYINYFPVRP